MGVGKETREVGQPDFLMVKPMCYGSPPTTAIGPSIAKGKDVAVSKGRQPHCANQRRMEARMRRKT